MKAARRSPGRIPLGTCTTPDSLSPADGKVTACSVIEMVSVGAGSGGRLYRIDARMEAGLLPGFRPFGPVPILMADARASLLWPGWLELPRHGSLGRAPRGRDVAGHGRFRSPTCHRRIGAAD